MLVKARNIFALLVVLAGMLFLSSCGYLCSNGEGYCGVTGGGEGGNEFGGNDSFPDLRGLAGTEYFQRQPNYQCEQSPGTFVDSYTRRMVWVTDQFFQLYSDRCENALIGEGGLNAVVFGEDYGSVSVGEMVFTDEMPEIPPPPLDSEGTQNPPVLVAPGVLTLTCTGIVYEKIGNSVNFRSGGILELRALGGSSYSMSLYHTGRLLETLTVQKIDSPVVDLYLGDGVEFSVPEAIFGFTQPAPISYLNGQVSSEMTCPPP